METQARETLMTVAELIGSATVRIERVTRSIRREEMDKLESAGIPGDIRWLREEYATLDDALRGSCSFIRDEWPAIQGNRGRLYELRLLEDSFSRFTSTITGFDDAVTADNAEKCIRLLAICPVFVAIDRIGGLQPGSMHLHLGRKLRKRRCRFRFRASGKAHADHRNQNQQETNPPDHPPDLLATVSSSAVFVPLHIGIISQNQHPENSWSVILPFQEKALKQIFPP